MPPPRRRTLPIPTLPLAPARLCSLLIPTLALAALAGCAHTYDPAAFRAAFREANQLPDRQQAIAQLEQVRRSFPRKRDQTDLAIARIYAQSGQPERSLEVLKRAQDAGVFFGLLPQMDWIQPLRYLREFQSVLARDARLRLEADRGSTMRYQVVKPADYTARRSYPLFIVLHGGMDDMNNARRYWHSDGLARYLVLYVQSFRHLTSSTYTWVGGDQESRAGLRRIYDEVAARYNVDPRRVFIGGMSAGGMMSLDVVLHDALPVTGFLVNCPVVPNDFRPEMAGDVRRRGIRGVIITGERDFSLESQKEIVAAFRDVGVPVRFSVVPGMGHALPPDFPAQVDAGLAELTGVGPTT